jgi:uncharacterized protein (TIGR03083 family)
MVTQARIADELRVERERLASYLESLPEEAWERDSLCEGWTVRELMAHVVGVASDVAHRRLEGVGTPEQNQRQVDERRGRCPRELLDEWRETGKLLEDGVLALDDELWTAPYSENFTVGQALQRMVEDIYVHGLDVRLALGDAPVEGPGLRSTLEVAEREWQGRIPRLAPDVGALHVSAGDFETTVPGPGSVEVKISGDQIALALVATGRRTLDAAVADGRLTVEPPAPAALGEAINIYG